MNFDEFLSQSSRIERASFLRQSREQFILARTLLEASTAGKKASELIDIPLRYLSDKIKSLDEEFAAL